MASLRQLFSSVNIIFSLPAECGREVATVGGAAAHVVTIRQAKHPRPIATRRRLLRPRKRFQRVSFDAALAVEVQGGELAHGCGQPELSRFHLCNS